MQKNLTYFSLAVLASALTAIFLFPPAATVGQSERGQCQQNCTRQYQQCRGAANANQDTCKQAFDACRALCRDDTNVNANGNVNGNTNTNTNGNTNINTNGNTNVNGNTNGNANGNNNGNANKP